MRQTLLVNHLLQTSLTSSCVHNEQFCLLLYVHCWKLHTFSLAAGIRVRGNCRAENGKQQGSVDFKSRITPTSQTRW